MGSEIKELQDNIITDNIIKKLIGEFSETRDEIKNMIIEIEEISKNVKDLFPDKFDARYRMIFQERVKATTELFKTLLDMRKELTKSIKDEIDIRRKIKSGKIENLEDLLDMSHIMDRIGEFQETTKKVKKKEKSINEIIELHQNSVEKINA